MAQRCTQPDLVTLDPGAHLWDQFFTVAPLVLIGTREPDGAIDLAPKHMVTPLGWDRYFGFVCAPSHATYRNAKRTGVFTVSYPRPSQFLQATLAAAPRCDDSSKPSLSVIATFPARHVDGAFAADGYLYFECEFDRVVDGFGENGLVIGKIVAAYVDRDSQRDPDADDQDLIHDAPLLAYLHPGRFAKVETSQGFPFPKDMRR